MKDFFSRMILSASGWRAVFAADGDENSMRPDLSKAGELICTAVAMSFASNFGLKKGDRILLASDSRPTGKALCSVVYRTLEHLGLKVCYAGICSAPETMAESSYGSYQAFFYISASHNPAGHNGFKFGRDGGVFSKADITPAIEMMKVLAGKEEEVEKVWNECRGADPEPDKELKRQSLEHYTDFIIRTTCPDGNTDELRAQIKKCSIGICADLNGSARSVSVDKDFLSYMGFKTVFVNDRAGEIVHGIIPEGKNLDTCRKLLEEMHAKDPDFVLGYVPDNDGDRGNIVCIDNSGKAVILEAQEVFALSVMSTLSYHKSIGTKNLAVAINGPTSMRIDRIAQSMGAKTFRAEVGEANAVSLADSLREKGYSVPILGEGSNGGNITYPARVRDPINTLMALTRLLVNGQTIPRAIENLPAFVTTNATEERAILRLKTSDYRTLKAEYEKALPGCFEARKQELATYGIRSWKEFQTEGIVERCESGNGDKGGLKISFYNSDETCIAYIWMRPSGTEPLFRILADVDASVKDAMKLHDLLIQWQRDMVLKAQEKVLKTS